jgi:hypothetical protein
VDPAERLRISGILRLIEIRSGTKNEQ